MSTFDVESLKQLSPAGMGHIENAMFAVPNQTMDTYCVRWVTNLRESIYTDNLFASSYLNKLVVMDYTNYVDDNGSRNKDAMFVFSVSSRYPMDQVVQRAFSIHLSKQWTLRKVADISSMISRYVLEKSFITHRIVYEIVALKEYGEKRYHIGLSPVDRVFLGNSSIYESDTIIEDGEQELERIAAEAAKRVNQAKEQYNLYLVDVLNKEQEIKVLRDKMADLENFLKAPLAYLTGDPDLGNLLALSSSVEQNKSEINKAMSTFGYLGANAKYNVSTGEFFHIRHHLVGFCYPNNNNTPLRWFIAIKHVYYFFPQGDFSHEI
jgi:hypothetical protein